MNYIYGLNKSGLSIANFLINNDKAFCCWDDNSTVRNRLKKTIKNIKFLKPTPSNLNKFKNIYVTPGISINKDIFKNLNQYSILKRDLNIYYENITNQKIIAITGTNGKSTTTKLIGDIFKKKYKKSFVGGNIGVPLCDSLLSNKFEKFHVIELSSFQLELIKNFNTKISIILNISNDHMDRYKNMRDYIKQKKNILSNSKDSYNLISIDDKYSRKISKNRIKNKILFSIKNSKANVFIKNNYIYDNYFSIKKKILIGKTSKDLNNKFNLQNIIVAYICCKIFNIPIKIFRSEIKHFKGLPYRSQIILRSNKLNIINDSKATNVDATLNSLKNLNNEDIYLIVGGKAKDKNFKNLSKYKKFIKKLYLYGESSFLIHNQLKDYIKTEIYSNLKIAINSVYKDTKKIKTKSTILFAPACTSFDQFTNFEERGLYFNKLVKDKFKNK